MYSDLGKNKMINLLNIKLMKLVSLTIIHREAYSDKKSLQKVMIGKTPAAFWSRKPCNNVQHKN